MTPRVRDRAATETACVCGRTFKNKSGHRNHAPTCDMETRRSAMFIKACETSDWTAYNAEWRRVR